jgi:hypothetical protein
MVAAMMPSDAFGTWRAKGCVCYTAKLMKAAKLIHLLSFYWGGGGVDPKISNSTEMSILNIEINKQKLPHYLFIFMYDYIKIRAYNDKLKYTQIWGSILFRRFSFLYKFVSTQPTNYKERFDFTNNNR